MREPPPQEESRASVVVAPPTIVQDSPGTLNQFVVDLTERVGSDAMIVHVFDELPEIDRDEYLDGIGASRRGQSSRVEISFIHPDRQIAQKTVEAVANRLIDDSARTEYDKTAYILEQAQARADEAERELAGFADTHGGFDPEIEYANVLSEIAAVDRQITTATIEDLDETSTETLNEQRADLVIERARLRSVLLPYERITAEVERARQVLEEARSDYVEAEFEYTTVNTPDELIVSRNVVRFVDDSARLQRAALGAFLAFLLTLIFLVPMAVWLQRRRLAGKHRQRDDNQDRIYDLTMDPHVDIDARIYERQ